MLRRLESAMAMSDAVWARHTNPASVWSRILTVPVPFVLIWFRDDLGLMLWPLLASAAVWFWLNPRIFPEPQDKSGWTSRSILGEQRWLREDRPEPSKLETLLAWVTYGIGGIGLLLAILGLVWSSIPLIVAGSMMLMLSKIAFLDVMVRYLKRVGGADAERSGGPV